MPILMQTKKYAKSEKEFEVSFSPDVAFPHETPSFFDQIPRHDGDPFKVIHYLQLGMNALPTH
jgi:hypothetical protein